MNGRNSAPALRAAKSRAARHHHARPAPSPELRRETPRATPGLSFEPPVPMKQARPVVPANVVRMISRTIQVPVLARVSTTGKVLAATPVASGGLEGFLGGAAASAVKLWQFAPAKRGGEAIEVEWTVLVTFAPTP